MPEPTTTPDPSVRRVIGWLLGITAPVHGHLAASVAFRILNLTLDIALFTLAAGGVVHLFTTGGSAVRILGVLAFVAVAKGAAYYLEQFMGHHVAFKAVELLREHVYDHLWPKAPGIIPRSRSGEVFATLTRDVDRIDIVYAHTVARFVSAYVVGAIAVTVGVLWAGWGPIWVAALALGVSLLVVPYLGLRTALAHTARALAARADLAHHLTDTEYGIREVLGYGRTGDRLAGTDERGRVIAAHSQGARRIMALRRAANTVLLLGAGLSVVILAPDSLGAPAVAALAGGTLRAFEGARAVEDATGYIDHALAAARRLWHLSHTPHPVTDGPEALTLEAPPTIRFEGVHYRYPGTDDRPPALDGVSLTIPPGSHTAIVGRSGSGKSTLVNLLHRHDDPTRGAITLDGTGVESFTLDSLRQHVAAVSQRSQLLRTTIAENLRLGAPGASEEQMWEALDVAGIAGEVRAMPESLDTIVGESAAGVSGGQAQRIALARAFLMRPQVLILDEFTSHLNTDLEDEIWHRIDTHLAGTTLIEVTHRLRAATRADEIVVIDEGRIVARGTPDELSPAEVADLFRTLRTTAPAPERGI